MLIDALWNRWDGGICWIVGTGPSLRVMPRQFLEWLDTQRTIGLNRAYQYLTPTFGLTIHPDELPEDKDERLSLTRNGWVLKRKGKPWAMQLPDNEPGHYLYRNNKDVHDMQFCRERVSGMLYAGRGIQSSAIVLAAYMGCKLAVMVGCDMNSLGDDHHGHAQHVRFHGLEPNDVYREYYLNTATVRRLVRENFGMHVITMNPFLGSGYCDEDYGRLCMELQLQSLPAPEDTSGYLRDKVDFG